MVTTSPRSWVASSISKRLFNAVGFEPDRDILVSCDNERTVDSIKKGDIEVKTIEVKTKWNMPTSTLA